MGEPELRNDEQVLARTMGVFVKSIPFEGILTSRRIILVDRAKNLLPPKEIPLATIRNAEPGENDRKEPVLLLSVMARTGETRQMILAFPAAEGGDRARERDAWAKNIREGTTGSFEQVIRKVIPGSDQRPAKAAPPVQPRIEVVNAPSPRPADAPGAAPSRRVVTAVHPIKKIVETGPAVPPPAPAAPAPVVPAPAVPEPEPPSPDEGVFCSRCGNRVSADSAFCNRCGSPIIAPAAAVPQRQAAAPLVAPAAQADDPLRQSFGWDEESPMETAPVPLQSPAPSPRPGKGTVKKGFLAGILGPGKKKEPKAPLPVTPAAPPVPPAPRPPKSPRPPLPVKKIVMGIAAVIVVILVVAVGALVVYPMLSSGGGGGNSAGSSASPAPTPGPSGSAPASPGTLTNTGVASITVKETPAVVVPASGVFVEINYIGSWTGTYGMASDLQTEINSGDRYFEVVNATGKVTASFQKEDSSTKHPITVTIFRNGKALATGSTSDAFGKVAISADVTNGTALAQPASESPGTGNATATTPPATPAPTATPAPAANATLTANATAAATTKP